MMHNFIICNQSECFIPAATTADSNIGESDFRRNGLSENLTFGETDFQTLGEV